MKKKTNYKKILFIDDDKGLLQNYNLIMERKKLADYFVFFNDANDGLDYLNSKPIDELPKYIVLDLYMPQMDGFEFLRRFQLLKEKKEAVEIYVCTSSKKKEDRDKVMKYPFVSAIIQKPLSVDFLELLIQH